MQAKPKKYTDLDLIASELVFPVLLSHVKDKYKPRYKEIVDAIKEQNPDVPEIQSTTHRHVGRWLGVIWDFTKSQGCPHIGSIVVKADDECGDGILDAIRDLEAERQKVWNYDWTNISLNFDRFILQERHHKSLRAKSRKKRKPDDAREVMSRHWAKIKNQCPTSEDLIIQNRDALIDILITGVEPEEAFSQFLIQIIKKFPKSRNKVPGYVYIGRYIDGETRKPIFDQYKVGFTTNLQDRAKALCGGVEGPLGFEMLAHWLFEADYAFAVEQKLHSDLGDYREKGEFFRIEVTELLQLVDSEICSKYSEVLLESNLKDNTSSLSFG